MPNFSEFKKNWKFDLNAGFALFLIAVPLSVGIAIASGAPPSSGLIAAIIGGILGSLLGGGKVNINGPAAGLIVIVLSSIQLLGKGDPALGLKYTFAVIVVAGILQICFGLLGWARLGLAFPSSVIHGMLTAIGMIILIKQIYVGLGVTPTAKSIFGLLFEIPQSLKKLNPSATAIALSTIFSLLGFQKLQTLSQFKSLKLIPAPLFAVFAGILTAHLLDSNIFHLINLPNGTLETNTIQFLQVPKNIFSNFIYPDFTQILSIDSWRMIFSFALVASLESTLSCYAVDKLDPSKNQSNLNRDLWSKGICNILCGFIGGLPIITEIVRSSANISNGAKSPYANFFHGIFVLAFSIFFPWMLNRIPLASLAALLIVVGWRLAHPSQFKHAFKIGPDHILAFAVTLIMTLMVDLLVGIFCGLMVEFVIALFMGVKLKNLFKPTIKTRKASDKQIIESHSPVIFSNSLTLRAHMLDFLESNNNVTVDLSRAEFIDHTVMDQLDSIADGFRERGLDFKVITSPQHRTFSDHALASRKI